MGTQTTELPHRHSQLQFFQINTNRGRISLVRTTHLTNSNNLVFTDDSGSDVDDNGGYWGDGGSGDNDDEDEDDK